MNEKRTAVLYVHGKGGNAAESEHYKHLFPEYDVIGLDYKAETIALSGKLEIARKALEEIDWCAQDYAKAQESLNEIKKFLERKDLTQKHRDRLRSIIRFKLFQNRNYIKKFGSLPEC